MMRLAVSDTVGATLKRSPRRRSIGIRVHRGEVIVSAPSAAPVAQIQHFLQQKRSWIDKHLKRQQQVLDVQRSCLYACGDPVQWLGQTLRLRINTAPQPTLLVGEVLQLRVHDDSLTQRKAALQDWYIEQACQYLPQRISHYQPMLDVRARGLKVRHYKSRWGSCNNRGELQFNWLLMMAPPQVVDYVVVHELAHLRHFNHSPAFWQLVASVMPDYAHQRRWLKNQTTLFW